MMDKSSSVSNLAKKRLGFLGRIPDKYDIQIFQLLPLYVKVKVLKEGRILYSKDKRKIYDTAYQTIKEYNLFEPHYNDYIRLER